MEITLNGRQAANARRIRGKVAGLRCYSLRLEGRRVTVAGKPAAGSYRSIPTPAGVRVKFPPVLVVAS